MPDTTVAEASARCERLRVRIETHEWPCLPADHRVTFSVGVAGTPPCDPELVVGAADVAMYGAKRAGRNLVRVASADDARDATPVAILRS